MPTRLVGVILAETARARDRSARHRQPVPRDREPLPTPSSIGATTLLESTRRQLRCLIIDDSPKFLDAVRRLLHQEGITVVGVGASSDDAVRLAEALRPDVTLVDIELGDEDGIAVARQLAGLASAPAGKLILVSTHDEDEFADLVEASPAIGFVPKAALSAQAIQALIDADRTRGPQP